MELFFGSFIVLYGLLILTTLAGYGLAIWAIIDAARRPDWAWHRARQDKTMWIVLLGVLLAVCVVADLVMALVYLFSIRPKLDLAEAAGPPQVPYWPGYGYPPPPQPPPYPYGSPPTYQ